MINYSPSFKLITRGALIALLFCVAALSVQAASPVVTPSDIPALFKSVYGRDPSATEEKYWINRIKDKPNLEALKGAMSFQRANGRVLGAHSNNLYEISLKDPVTKSAPGELVTYSVTIKNIYSENTVLSPQLSITAQDLEITSASDHGSRGKLSNGKAGGTIDWNRITSQGQKNRYAFQLDSRKSHTFTFQVKTPDTLGSEYCVKADLFPFLQASDCNTVVKSTKKQATPTPTPTPKTVLKITEKDFRIVSPDSLNTDRADQEITWYSSPAVTKRSPNAKLELCPGKDFKGCIILEAVVENDGSQIINMPPVPRIGKWYLHLIGRDNDENLITAIAAARLITLHQ